MICVLFHKDIGKLTYLLYCETILDTPVITITDGIFILGLSHSKTSIRAVQMKNNLTNHNSAKTSLKDYREKATPNVKATVNHNVPLYNSFDVYQWTK